VDTLSQAESSSTILTFDIAIVGGGMVGMALALALAQQSSLSIVILESAAEAAAFRPDVYHHRVSALALSSMRIFQALHVWNDIKAARVSPFTAIQVWDTHHRTDLNFVCNEIGEPVLGYIVENIILQQCLRAQIKTLPQVHYMAPVTLREYREDDNGVTLITKDNQHYRARLAVAADGANSWLRDQAGMNVSTVDYDQEAIVATVTTEFPHEKIARQIFLPTGPLAFLPLAEASTSSIVWSLPKAEARRLAALEQEIFQQELTQAFAERLGDVCTVGKRFVFPLKKQQAENYVSGRVVLVGDAAHVIHPLAGQGVNLGLLDAASLAEVILDAVRTRRDVADTASLRRYERWRRADNLALLTGVDIIKQLFASEKIPVRTLTGLGMAVTSRLAVLKNIFTRYAVGCRDDLPALAKPDQSG
jgi:2-octaprenylphenol hydroxylase